MSYKIINFTESQIEAKCIIRNVDMSFIPIDLTNPDYCAYLAWLEEGNTPEPWNENTIGENNGN